MARQTNCKTHIKLKGEDVFMKFRIFAIVCALLACASISNAGLIGYSVDFGIQGENVAWDPPGISDNYELDLTATQKLSPGNFSGAFTTGSPDDPSLLFDNDLNNNTGTTWTAYEVQLSMDHLFSVVPASVLVVTPGGWTSTISPVVQVGNLWKVTIDYYAGTPVNSGNPGDEFEYMYKISFLGTSDQIHYNQVLTPTPEPCALVLLVCGVLGLLAVRRRFV
jgi:hypothetical protein